MSELNLPEKFRNLNIMSKKDLLDIQICGIYLLDILEALSASRKRVEELEFLLDHPNINEGFYRIACEFCGAKTKFTVNKAPFVKHEPDCSYLKE